MRLTPDISVNPFRPILIGTPLTLTHMHTRTRIHTHAHAHSMHWCVRVCGAIRSTNQRVRTASLFDNGIERGVRSVRVSTRGSHARPGYKWWCRTARRSQTAAGLRGAIIHTHIYPSVRFPLRCSDDRLFQCQPVLSTDSAVLSGVLRVCVSVCFFSV